MRAKREVKALSKAMSDKGTGISLCEKRRKVVIIIPYHNQVAYLEKCLRSLAEMNSPAFDVKVILIDNASAEQLNARLLDRLGLNYLRIRNERNEGVTGPWNMGIKIGLEEHNAEAACLLNSDVIVGPKWMEHCIGALDNGAYCAIPFVYSEQDMPEDFQLRSQLAASGRLAEAYQSMKVREQGDCFRKYVLPVKQVDYHETDGLWGFCFWLSKRCIEEIGYFDEAMTIICSDTDYRNRLIRAGHLPVCVHTCMIHHYANKTILAVTGADVYKKVLEQDHLYFQQKWSDEYDRNWRNGCCGRVVT
jgi:GT2 family glycosyltransferase